MKNVTDTELRDVKASIAFEAAKILDRKDRVASFKGLLRVDEDEARQLIARGRRIAKLKADAAA